MAGNYGNAPINYIVSFNGILLNATTVPYLQIYAIDDYMPDRTLAIYPLARIDAQKVAAAFYQKRIIYVAFYIAAPSRALADQSIDILNGLLQGIENTLIIEKSGTTRAYTATFEKIAKNTSGVGRSNVAPPQGGLVDATLQFEASDSYGYDQFFTPMFTLYNLTASPNNWNYNFGGSAPTQVPIINIYFTGGSLGSGTVMIGNQTTGQTISITRTWSVGDTLTVDTQHNTVQVNGVNVAFSGAFPTFQVGLQTLTYQDTFTSRTYQLYATYFKRWV